MDDSNGWREPPATTRPRRRALAQLGLAEDGTPVLLAMPGGVDDAPLGTRCALCGSRAEGRELLLMIVGVRVTGADAGRRLVCVHPRCTRYLCAAPEVNSGAAVTRGTPAPRTTGPEAH